MVTSILGIHGGLNMYTNLSDIAISAITIVSAIASCFIFSKFGTNRISKRLNKMTEVIRTIAEGEGNLTQRLDANKIKHDETGDLSRWINSFIDNLDGIVGQVIHALTNVKETN
jgi:methyl-accepting chemotaxis protein